MKQLLLIALISMLGGVSMVNAQTAKKKDEPKRQSVTTKKPVEPKAQAVTLAPFSLDVLTSGRLSPNFEGFPPDQIADALEKLAGLTKGEFETTADFEARKASQLSASYVPNLGLGDTHAFVINVGKAERFFSGVGYRYDADSSTVDVLIVPREKAPNGIGGPNYSSSMETIRQRRNAAPLDSFDLSTKITAQEKYDASNAYGAKVLVEKTIMSSVALGLNRIDFVDRKKPFDMSLPAPVSKFTMEPTQAGKVLPALKALFLVKLAVPYLEFDYSHKEPKRDSPTDISIQTRIIRGNIEAIVIYSGATGEIFMRLPNTKPE